MTAAERGSGPRADFLSGAGVCEADGSAHCSEATRTGATNGQLETPEKKNTRTAAAFTQRQPQEGDMNDTYAVVTKAKQPRPPSSVPAYSHVATPIPHSANRTPPSSHHYDNDPADVPIYSTVQPRAPPICNTANHKPGEGLAPLGTNGDYQLMPAQPADDDYEDFSSSLTDGPCSAAGMGFNCRPPKPRGPRDPPAEWSRLER